DPDHALGRLEAGDAPGLEPGPARVEVERAGRDDEGADALAEPGVGVPDRYRVADERVRLQHALHLGRGDVLAAPDDDVLDAADDRQPAVGVHRRQVAGAEPAPRDGGTGLLRVRIADEQLGAAQPELARVARRARTPGDGVGDAQLGDAGDAAVG